MYREAIIMNKRLITEKQEQALRLVRHDLGGLSQDMAAIRMGISQQAISKLLAACEKVAPQLFPILTKQEARLYYCYMVEGWSPEEMVKADNNTGGNLTLNAVYKTFQRCKAKGLKFPGGRGKVLQLQIDKAEHQIVHKF